MTSIISEYEDKLPSKIIEEVRNNLPKGVSDTKLRKIIEAVCEEYKNAKVHPGESVGLISAESIGEPGTQMSIPFSEKIIIRIDDRIKAVKIGKIVDSLMGLKGCFKFNDSEILPLNDLEIYVPSLNQEEKIEWKRVLECSRHKTPEKLIKITTASGREIIATDSHSFVTRINNYIKPIRGDNLKIGDRIPVINNFFAESELKEIKINEGIFDQRVVEEEDMLSIPETRTKPIRNSINLDRLTGWFIGAYLAEGFTNAFSLSISNISNSYMQNAREFISSLGLIYIEQLHNRGFAYGRDLKVNSVLLSGFIAASCGMGSAYKKVPDFAYSANKEFVSGLLRGYFDGDGNFHVDRKMIRVSSNSRELLQGISLLLSRFKIFSFKISDKKNQHWLLIPYKYAPQFLAYIGSDIEHKRKSLEELAEKAGAFWNETSQDYTDMISGFGNLLYRAAKKIGYPTRYVNNFTKRQKIGRTVLYRYIKLFEEIAKNKGIDIINELNTMKKMFNSDIIWDEIIDIRYVNKEHEHVYDLSVSGLETFTTFDGIITHNTLNTFHFAGVAEMNVTLGLPRIIEILDGRKELDNPMMEIYLKKPYATGKKIEELRQLALQIRETKLKDIATEFAINIADFTIEIKLDKEKMKELELTLGKVLDALSKQLKGYNIKDSKDTITLKPRSKDETFNEAYKTKEKIKEIMIKGIKGILQVLPVKREEEFVIITAGSNLADVLQLEEVDAYRTTTNNIFEIEQVLGIEAARQAIINEIFKVIESQGLNVDVRHIMLVADTMCVSGTLKGITRYGVVSEKSSVLARASFETPIKHIINAALVGEVDNLNSVVENVMINQPVPIGTGLPSLAVKPQEKKGKEK